MSKGDLLGLGKTILKFNVLSDGEAAKDTSIACFINDQSGLDYLYIFTASKGWQYLKL